ncbi:zinc transporter [Sphingomonas gellani]|uniref:Zinc transporter n=1 Tax=Sphingomonas gellani TaxID=1166340 RepID=A0A1H8CDY3_9SPHN|nr:zinc transporter ZntB [Sphingomonas gellani]SEM93245.1 zinc transporter [Sphingomonas gellani]
MSGFAYRIDDGSAEQVDLHDAFDSPAHLIWTHLETTDDRAKTWFKDRAGLDEYVIDALTAAETRPRCEKFESGALLNLRGRSEETLSTSDPLASIRIWAVKGHVYSATRKPLVAVTEVRKEVEAGDIRDPGDLITAFATAITADLDPVVADLGDELDDCEEALDANRVFTLRRTVTRVRVQAIGLRRFINPQRSALETLAALPGDWLGADDRQHLSAAADRAARMAEELEAIRERAALTHEQLTDLRAEQLDIRSLIISIVAMIFLPLTFVTGVYGMNVKGLPWADEPWAFDAVMGMCAGLAVLISVFFVARHWFRN